MIDLASITAISASLFCLGLLGVFIHRNVIAMWIGVEIMLAAGMLALVGFDRHWALVAGPGHQPEGQVLAFMILAAGTAQMVVGAALLLACRRNRNSLNIEGFDLLKW